MSDSILCGVCHTGSTREIVTIILISFSFTALTVMLILHSKFSGELLGHIAAEKDRRYEHSRTLVY